MNMGSILMMRLLFFQTSCVKTSDSSSRTGGCGTHNVKSLYKGPDGGCYYINDNGNKEYVDRNECRC